MLRRWLNPRTSRSRRALPAALAALPSLCLFACGDPRLVLLGDRDPPSFRFEPPVLVAELSAPEKTDNPTLTADMLTIFFTSEREGGTADIFVAERPTRDEAFGAVRRVDALSSAGTETSPAVSADGLTLWFASDREGGLGDLDVWVATRRSRDEEFAAPAHVGPLSSSDKDIPRPLGQRGRVMPMASDRGMSNCYQTYFSARGAAVDAFDEPAFVPELAFEGQCTVDAFLSDDGQALLYVTGVGPFGQADVFVATRRTLGEAFELHRPLQDVNTERDERDPWLSPDGEQLYFASDRSGEYAIYSARRLRDAEP